MERGSTAKLFIMSKLVITIDTCADKDEEVTFELSGDKDHYFKLPILLGAFIDKNDDAKVYLVGAVTRAAEQNPFIARNIIHDLANHQMNRLLGNKNTMESMRFEIRALKEK